MVCGFTLASCGGDADLSSATYSDASDGGTSGISDEDADRLAEARGQLEDLQNSGSLGSGSGSITVDGVDYAFEARTCYSDDRGFEANGPGQTADGVPYWASLSTGISLRSEMLASGLPEANVDAFFGDADSIQSFGLEVELGKEDRFSSGDDLMSNFRIDVIKTSESDVVSFSVDGNTMSGTGSATDYNGVAFDYGVTVPAAFSASCN